MPQEVLTVIIVLNIIITITIMIIIMCIAILVKKHLVPRGLEPRTLRLLAARSNQLSYESNCLLRHACNTYQCKWRAQRECRWSHSLAISARWPGLARSGSSRHGANLQSRRGREER